MWECMDLEVHDTLHIYVCTSKLKILQIIMWNRDGTKSKGDKIGMPCTHSTAI